MTERLRFEYIPAIRTDEHAQRAIDEVLSARLRGLEHNPDYVAALETVRRLQVPVLDALSAELTGALADFLPGVKEVRVELTQAQRLERMRTPSDVIVDDGAATPLYSKGDGIISLAAIGLMQRSLSGARGRELLLAIEEPEAHLHPHAMHRLREVLRDLSATQQVLITTHSPLFVDRTSASANVLVLRSKAEPAKKLSTIREALGVRVQDNMLHAEVVPLVEGGTDRDVIASVLRSSSPAVVDALEDGRLAIQVLGGCDKLAAAVYALDHCVVQWHCLLDHDKAAHDAFDELVKSKTARHAQATFTTLVRHREAEIEDWYRLDAYQACVETEYGPVLSSTVFQQTKGKWSTRVGAAFTASGQDWSAEENRVKRLAADAVVAASIAGLTADALPPFGALQRAIETALRAAAGVGDGDRARQPVGSFANIQVQTS